MRILGLTGGIAMGKSTAAKAFRRLGIPVHDADATVHRLYRAGGAAVAPIAEAFPEAVVEGAVDRGRLGALVLGRPEALRRLEGIMHPLVRQATRRWLATMARRRCGLVVLDIPLLYETGGEGLCDAVLVVSAPGFLQQQRALSRSGMSEEKLAAILARQVKDHDRRRRADYLVFTGLGKGQARRSLGRVVARERSSQGRVWAPGFGRTANRKRRTKR